MNVSDRLEQRLTDGRLYVLRELSRLAACHGIDLYLVGGSVRDILANAPLTDIDIMASGNAERLVESIRGQREATVPKGLGIRNLVFDRSRRRSGPSDGPPEIYKRPGALPSVFPGTVEDDLARRDFSINAMAISLGGDSWGDLLDPHGGARDLEHGLIRVLHEQSFEDDATRILRAIRYACRRDFRLEARSGALLERCLPYLSTISPDRVRHEIERIFREQLAGAMIEMAGRLGILAAIHPGLRAETGDASGD